jgi:hypothetical protein
MGWKKVLEMRDFNKILIESKTFSLKYATRMIL